LGLVNDNFAGLVILDAISHHPQLNPSPPERTFIVKRIHQLES
jgi:hypothetical protein